jgi:hypothetical protein
LRQRKKEKKKKKENRQGKEWLINTVMGSQIVQISNYSNSFVLSFSKSKQQRYCQDCYACNQNIIYFCTQNYVWLHLKICLFKKNIKLIFFYILILKIKKYFDAFLS